jgi:LuxR family maltose regulon positive regulatory protein
MGNNRVAATPRRPPVRSLLRAKLRPPVPGSHYVRRPRLLELLDELVDEPLTVVVAPAGAGKTSLLAGWAAESALPIAWLSVDDADRDGVQLWSEVVAALETLTPECGDRALVLLRRAGRLDEAVAQLLVDLDARQHSPAVLVIDDVHLVDEDDAVAGSLALFVRHLPVWLRVVLASRRVPKLPLDRLRAQGRLGELHFTELRFSPTEAKELLAGLAPTLSTEAIAAAADRADGWAASLQLAALAARSLRAQPAFDAPRIDDGALVQDYVFHEVLVAEAPEVVDALFDLSVVERANSSLAVALTGRSDAGELLLRAEARGIFVTRIGPEGSFAMHSLVRTVLMDELARRSPERLAQRHLRAARWFEEAGEVPLALDHLLAAGQPRDALRLLAAEHANVYDTGREATIARTIAAIPSSAAAADLQSMIEFAWCHLLVNRRRFLEIVEQTTWLAGQSEPDEALRARLTMLQSIAATVYGRWTESGALARQAMRDLGQGWWRDPLGRFGWNMVAREVALTERWDDARDDVREAELALSRDPERRVTFEGTRALGAALAGRPLEALRVAAGVRHAASVSDMTILRAELATAEAVAHRELGDHVRARDELEALAAAPADTMAFCRLLAWVELVQASLDEGDYDAAHRAFEDAQAFIEAESFGSDARSWLARVGTRVALAAGDTDDARLWSTQIDDDFWGGVSVARVLLAEGDRRAVIDILDTAAPRSVRHEVVVGLLRCRATNAHDDALKHATAAVELAAAHGILQTVASEGAELLELVEQTAWRAPPPWMDRLRRLAVTTRGDPVLGRRDPDALTDRERDVLRFLPSRLTLGEIASELYVSVNTLKFHLKIIYRKLGVTSRAEAAEVARRSTMVGRPILTPPTRSTPRVTGR